MLVLSRRLNEAVLFPGTQTAVKVLAIRGGVVRLGIDAPPEVRVLRQERADRPMPPACAALAQDAAALGQRLRALAAGLGLARLQLDAGRAGEARAALRRLHEDLQALWQGDRADAGPGDRACGGRTAGTAGVPCEPADGEADAAHDFAGPPIDLGPECELLAACAG
jgi:carbon storage regulator CsrA